MGQFFTHDNEAFFNELVEKYGPVSKLIGSLGVRMTVVLARWRSLTFLATEQNRTRL